MLASRIRVRTEAKQQAESMAEDQKRPGVGAACRSAGVNQGRTGADDRLPVAGAGHADFRKLKR